MKRLAFLLGLILFGGLSCVQAQSSVEARRLETIWLRAEVIGILPVEGRMAVLQVKAIDAGNPYNLQPPDEILAVFHFAPGTVDGQEFPEIKGGEIIRAEIHGSYNQQTSQFDYRVFRYQLSPADSLKPGAVRE